MSEILDRSVDLSRAFQSFWKMTVSIPTLGIAVLDETGNVVYSNTAFRRIMFHDENFNPAGNQVESLEGRSFASEVQQHIGDVLNRSDQLLIRLTRFGTRLEIVLAPWKPNGHQDETTLVVSYVHRCVEIADSDLRIPTCESEFNSWGELDYLTDRQLEVLACLREGLTQKQIAERLGIAPKTVETHRDQLVHRLGLNSTIEAIRMADRAGLTLENSRKPRHRERPWTQKRADQDAGADVA